MEPWITRTLIAYGVLFAAGFVACLLVPFLSCEKLDALPALIEGAIFALPPALVSVLERFVPAAIAPFVNVVRDTFGVDPEKAPAIGLGYVMMLVAWVMGTRMVTRINKQVCIPTVDEVAEFRKNLQNRVAKQDVKEEKSKEEASKKKT